VALLVRHLPFNTAPLCYPRTFTVCYPSNGLFGIVLFIFTDTSIGPTVSSGRICWFFSSAPLPSSVFHRKHGVCLYCPQPRSCAPPVSPEVRCPVRLSIVVTVDLGSDVRVPLTGRKLVLHRKSGVRHRSTRPVRPCHRLSGNYLSLSLSLSLPPPFDPCGPFTGNEVCYRLFVTLFPLQFVTVRPPPVCSRASSISLRRSRSWLALFYPRLVKHCTHPPTCGSLFIGNPVCISSRVIPVARSSPETRCVSGHLARSLHFLRTP